MRNYIAIFMLFLSGSSYCQTVKSSVINNKEKAKLLGSIESYEFFKGQQLSMGIFKVSNGPGSANLPESHEISHQLLLSVAEYDENPVHKLYSIGPFILPKVTMKVDSGHLIRLLVEHGVSDSRKTINVVAGLTTIQHKPN
ncbi:hypothetical protein [Pedobacter sp.]|uniref:hypothetical protein n=1 Tax=Pedobacter sp. TaxID=1411316 RepID=UPI003D7FADCC